LAIKFSPFGKDENKKIDEIKDDEIKWNNGWR
jgi:hypothetical protein